MKKIKIDIFQLGQFFLTILAIIVVCDFASLFNSYSERHYNLIEIIIHILVIIITLFLYYTYTKMHNENKKLKNLNKSYVEIIDKKLFK